MKNYKQKILDGLKTCLSDLKKFKELEKIHNKDVSRILAVNTRCISDSIDVIVKQTSDTLSKFDLNVISANVKKCCLNYMDLGEIANDLSDQEDIGDFNNVFDKVLQNVEDVVELVKFGK